MRLTLSTSYYNARRSGRPWIAVVDFADPKGTFRFGQWIGADGEAGELSIEVEPGDVIARGQKDFRKPANSAPSYYLVKADGTLSESVTKVDAYQAWHQARQDKHASQPRTDGVDLSSVATEALIAELRRRGVNA